MVGQAGVLALGPGATQSLFRRWLPQARALAAEWAELRGVHRHQLAGTVVRTPLQVGLWNGVHHGHYGSSVPQHGLVKALLWTCLCCSKTGSQMFAMAN